MTDDKRVTVGDNDLVDLQISEPYFRLITEGIRLHSNTIFRYSTFGDIIDERAPLINELMEKFDIDDLQQHVRIIPTRGDVHTAVVLCKSSIDILNYAVPDLALALRSGLSLASAISLLLFDWLVERQATEIVMKLG